MAVMIGTLLSGAALLAVSFESIGGALVLGLLAFFVFKFAI